MSDVFLCSIDVFRCFQMFSNVLRMLSIAHRHFIDILKCVQDVFGCYNMFKGFQMITTTFKFVRGLWPKFQFPPLRRRMFALPYKSFWRVVGGLFDNKIMSGNLSHWCRRGIFPEEKMPSEMEVALPYTLFTLQHCLHCFTGYTVYTIQIVLHCLYYSNCLTLLKQEHM